MIVGETSVGEMTQTPFKILSCILIPLITNFFVNKPVQEGKKRGFRKWNWSLIDRLIIN
jgi:hypothetical protein